MSNQITKEAARKLLSDRFGHKDFRRGQWEPFNALLSGKDTLVVMPTGSGKSVIYQLPAVLLPGLTIVVSPLIALMKDQHDKLSAQGVSSVAMHSHLSTSETREAHRQIAEGEGEIGLLFPPDAEVLDEVEAGVRVGELAFVDDQAGVGFFVFDVG